MTGNSSIRKHENEIENKILFKIKNWYYLELVAHEMMKSLASAKSKITKDENGENLLHLEMKYDLLKN